MALPTTIPPTLGSHPSVMCDLSMDIHSIKAKLTCTKSPGAFSFILAEFRLCLKLLLTLWIWGRLHGKQQSAPQQEIDFSWNKQPEGYWQPCSSYISWRVPLKIWFLSNRKPGKFWQWFLQQQARLYGPWITMLLMAVNVLYWTSSGRLQAGWHNSAGQWHGAKILMPGQWSSGQMALCPQYSALFTYSAYVEHCSGCPALELAGSTWAYLLLSEYRRFLQLMCTGLTTIYIFSHLYFGSWGII